MALLPGIFKRSFEPRRYLVNHHPLVQASDVVLDRTSRSPLPPLHRLQAGTVVVRHRQGRTFVPASDPQGARSTSAEVTALQATDPTWAGSQITVSMARGLGFPFNLDAQATSTAEVLDQLNRNPLFAVHFLADDAGGLVRIRTREAGAHKVLVVESSLPAAFGPLGAAGQGRDADYRVIDDAAELRDLEGNAIEAVVPSLAVGHFVERELIDLTPEARAVLSRRGSLFA